MRSTLSIIKADVGSIAGHVTPSQELLGTIDDQIAAMVGASISDYFLGGDRRRHRHPDGSRQGDG